MKNSDEVINKEMIFLQQDYADMDSALNLLINKADEIGLIDGTKDYMEAVLKRERDLSTAIGYQVAIPHGKSDTVINPFIGFLSSKNEFQWSEHNDELVDMVFLIGVPKENKNNVHLKFISILSKKLLDDNFRNQLKNATNTEEAYKILISINNEIKDYVKEV